MKKTGIVSEKIVLATPWFKFLARRMKGDSGKWPHYVIDAPDYVCVFALASDGKVLMVKQFRPALGRSTVELPSGHVEKGQTPAQAARAELLEETGYRAKKLELVGVFRTDAGRMTNRTWCFFSDEVVFDPKRKGEPGIKRLSVPLDKLLDDVRSSRLDHAINLACILMALLKGRIGAVSKRGARA